MENEINILGDIFEDNGYGSMAGRVYAPEGLAPAFGASHFQQVKYICETKDLTSNSGEIGLSKQASKQARLIYRQGVDLCYTQSQLIDVANAIAARYDAGICRHKNEHPGVIEIWELE